MGFKSHHGIMEVYKRIIDEMLDNIDDMNDADKKMLINLHAKESFLKERLSFYAIQ